ncbi:tRNA(Ile)-lysidine synthetase [Paramagnetospirillum marisnigri]|uniref:tRNA(Ile)-lysidine synthase n=1 Tax=Paramagnetospirillum marisnigri TaxID=1285242 RepID=A0A178MR22_9PROT|nr:tRNA lysidine(34) synthetase TilS [Paramagnetospirillum marisnigri]OAN50497.1 tRNA(Ile)-lysidine synthetase [Paramagnetospirillum marisnigri]
MTQAPISSDDFAALMAPLGPFEARPRLAVAVSGGGDSLALALLAKEWAAWRGGSVLALTVDHGLRPESGAEAELVATWMSAHAVPHRILAWTGPKPDTDIQASARAARHALLAGACREAGILHLLLAHHREDQAETLLLRLGRGSGVDGLAAMAPIQATAWGRLLRPLLEIHKARLSATLRQLGQDWIEDPSNQNSAYARIRLRRLAPDLAAEGLSAERLAATASRMARVRAALDQAVAAAAARWVELHPAGFARCAAVAFTQLPEEIGLRLLARLVMAVGGGVHPPRLERLERLFGMVRDGTADATLAGCRVACRGGEVVLCRELARQAPPQALLVGMVQTWDGRFRAVLADDAPAGLRLGGLGRGGWRQVAVSLGSRRLAWVPSLARATIPALWREDDVFAVPHLGYNLDAALQSLRRLDFSPVHRICAGGPRLV